MSNNTLTIAITPKAGQAVKTFRLLNGTTDWPWNGTQEVKSDNIERTVSVQTNEILGKYNRAYYYLFADTVLQQQLLITQ